MYLIYRSLRRSPDMSRKKVRLSVIVEAIEGTFDGWEQFYNTATGEVESLPDPDNSFADEDDLEEKYEEIDSSDDYVRLPSRDELNEYSIMENFAEEKGRKELFSVLRGRRPFRRFKDMAGSIGLIDEYYRFRTNAFARIAREWCEENDIPYTDDLDSEQVLRIKHYEELFDRVETSVRKVKNAVKKFEELGPVVAELEKYYESDLWKNDFADDEAGKLPRTLKRGVLSEDGVYDLLEEVRRIRELSEN
jgi:hypothetical protein